jgi:hypothetical protein
MREKARHFTSRLVAATIVAALVVPAPASAQFGGLFKKPAAEKNQLTEAKTKIAPPIRKVRSENPSWAA